VALLEIFGVQAFRQKYNSADSTAIADKVTEKRPCAVNTDSEDCAAIADKKTENGHFSGWIPENPHGTRGNGESPPVFPLPDALGRALESLYPAGCLERIATMTDAEIDEYAGRFGVTGAELMAGIFDPARNADYMNHMQTLE